MLQKTFKVSGWILTGILSLLFLMSAAMKIFQPSAAIEQTASIGFDATTYLIIGVVELVALILFIIPRTGILGSLLLIAYMGGAIATHLQNQESIFMPVIVQILVWIAAFLRFPELRSRVFAVQA